MIRSLWNKLPAWVRKLMPSLTLLTVLVLVLGTDWFNSAVKNWVETTLKERATSLMPVAIDLLIAGVILNIAWLAHGPLSRMAEKAFDRSGASERGKQLGLKVVTLVFWGFVVMTVLSMFASELMGKFVVGFSVLGAALTLAMQGAANDFICGVLMQFSQRVRCGDDIKVVGMEVDGKVKDIGYLSTTVDGADGVLTVPNRKIWESVLKVKKPQKKPSLLILPESFRDCRKD